MKFVEFRRIFVRILLQTGSVVGVWERCAESDDFKCWFIENIWSRKLTKKNFCW